MMLDLANEFGFKIAAFHHAVEAYKIADRLAQRASAARSGPTGGASRWRPSTASRRTSRCVDAPRRLRDRALGFRRRHPAPEPGGREGDARGQRAGIDIPPEHAIRWLTANPAKALGIDDQTGTLEPGKMADVVVWNGTRSASTRKPNRCTSTARWRSTAAIARRQPRSDFLLGQPGVHYEPRSHRRTAALFASALCTGRTAQDLLIRNATVHTADVRRHARTRRRAGARRPHRRVGSGLAAGSAGWSMPGPAADAGCSAASPTSASASSGWNRPRSIGRPSSTVARRPGFLPRPEFDVTPAYNADAAAIGVNRAEGITFVMIAPSASGTLFAGQGAVARLDGSDSPFVVASRTQFLDMGSSATDGVGFSRGAQFMLLEQAATRSVAWQAAAGRRRLPADTDGTRSLRTLPRRRSHGIRRGSRGRHPAGAGIRGTARREACDRRWRAGVAGSHAARPVESTGGAGTPARPARHVRPARRLAAERGAAAARGCTDHVHAFFRRDEPVAQKCGKARA